MYTSQFANDDYEKLLLEKVSFRNNSVLFASHDENSLSISSCINFNMCIAWMDNFKYEHSFEIVGDPNI